MAVIVTPNMTVFFDCDADSGMTASQGTPDLSTDVVRESSGSIGSEIRTAGVQWLWHTEGSSTDLSNTHVYVWINFLFVANLYNETSGGVRIRVGDGTNWGDWTVAGADTYGGGWRCFVADTAAAFDYDSGTPPNLAAITQIGLALNIESTARNLESTFLDIIRYGDGAWISSDSSSTFEDIEAYSNSTADGRAHGVIRYADGVYFTQGKLVFGTVSGTEDCYVADQSQTIMFTDEPVASDLYEVLIEGNSTGTTDVQFGNLSGDAGIQGCTFAAVSPQTFTVTASGVNINASHFYGCTFQNADVITLSNEATSSGSLISCNFDTCGMVSPRTEPVQYCKFIGSTGYALWMEPDHNISDCDFITCPSGVLITASGTYTFDNLQFTGCTYDVVNNSGEQVLIQATNTANPSTYYETVSGTTTIQNAVTLTLTGLVTNSEVRIYEAGTTTELDGIENCSATFEYTYNYQAGTYVDIVVHNLGYEYFRQKDYLLAGTATDLPIAQRADRWYSNP